MKLASSLRSAAAVTGLILASCQVVPVVHLVNMSGQDVHLSVPGVARPHTGVTLSRARARTRMRGLGRRHEVASLAPRLAPPGGSLRLQGTPFQWVASQELYLQRAASCAASSA